jgi:predicted phosphodiesterase
MRYLILSDIHANWEALVSVLAHADGKFETICCLGDMVGYGADPNRVTEWVREHCDFVIRGNHDRACCGLDSAETFNPAARASCDWTSAELSAENRGYLSDLASGPVGVNGFSMVHGSFTDEDEYLIYPQDVAQQGEAEGNPVFFGHTHIQGGFVQFDQKVGRIHPSGDAVELRPDWVHWVNPGSVGQPRDMVWEAGYALYDSEKRLLTYQRCPYDVSAAQEKIQQAGLPPELAMRLSLGR